MPFLVLLHLSRVLKAPPDELSISPMCSSQAPSLRRAPLPPFLYGLNLGLARASVQPRSFPKSLPLSSPPGRVSVRISQFFAAVTNTTHVSKQQQTMVSPLLTQPRNTTQSGLTKARATRHQWSTCHSHSP